MDSLTWRGCNWGSAVFDSRNGLLNVNSLLDQVGVISLSHEMEE